MFELTPEGSGRKRVGCMFGGVLGRQEGRLFLRFGKWSNFGLQ